MILMDSEIKKLCTNGNSMIEPFIDHQVRVDDNGKKVISYGLSAGGYDVRLANEFKLFTNINTTVIDPLAFDELCLHDHCGDYAIIPPNSYMLGRTVETFNIPRDIMVVCVGKSSWARVGCGINVTPIEPGFIGQVVIEISNFTPSPLKIHAGMGIAQFLFFRSNKPCEVSYADRGGKYQNQSGVQLAIV